MSSSTMKLPNEITIRVFDENRKINRDFYCDRHLLSNKMAYFKV